MTRRTILHIGIGDGIELAGCAGACYAVSMITGLGWAILLGSLVLIVKANLEYAGAHVAIPLPSPRRDARVLRHAFSVRVTNRRRAVRNAVAMRRLRRAEARLERRGVVDSSTTWPDDSQIPRWRGGTR
jgi:hypothetical protein